MEYPVKVAGEEETGDKKPESLKWYQWVWIGAPALLVFVGGLIGGLVGGAAVAINSQIFRSNMNEVLKYIITAVISICSVIVYLVAATWFTELVQGG